VAVDAPNELIKLITNKKNRWDSWQWCNRETIGSLISEISPGIEMDATTEESIQTEIIIEAAEIFYICSTLI